MDLVSKAEMEPETASESTLVCDQQESNFVPQVSIDDCRQSHN